ncbi:MAG: 4Fe-4S dicluster domain-containing protein [Syntrophothermus sp.]
MQEKKIKGKAFGYSISSDRQINYDLNDHSIVSVISTIEPTIAICLGCGSCTATCSAGNFTSFNIRRIHTFIRRSEYDGLAKELEKCMFCGKCQLACPRGVNLRNLILACMDKMPTDKTPTDKTRVVPANKTIPRP